MDFGETTAVVVMALTLSLWRRSIRPGARRASIRSRRCVTSDTMIEPAAGLAPPDEEIPILFMQGVERHYRQGDATLHILNGAEAGDLARPIGGAGGAVGRRQVDAAAYCRPLGTSRSGRCLYRRRATAMLPTPSAPASAATE
jgi:hypothetical protein